MSLLLKWEVSFTDLHNSQERFSPPPSPPAHTHTRFESAFRINLEWHSQNQLIFETPVIFKANYLHVCKNSFMGNFRGKQKMESYLKYFDILENWI